MHIQVGVLECITIFQLYGCVTTKLALIKFLLEFFVILNVKDHLPIRISVKQLQETAVLHKELLKFNLKQVFDPNDKPTFPVATTDTWIQTGKRIFDSRNKNYCFVCRGALRHLTLGGCKKFF